jgi:hypothetical protein
MTLAPKCFAIFGRGDADATACRMNEDRFVWLQSADDDRELPGGQVVYWDRRALVCGHAFRAHEHSGGPTSEIQICRMAPHSAWEQLIARAQRRQPNLHFWPSQPPRSYDRVPEEHAKKRDHNNPKDKAPRVATTGLVIVGSQPVGIAHAILFGRPPASQPHQTLIKDFLNLSFGCRCSQTPEGAFGQSPDTRFVAAGWRGS